MKPKYTLANSLSKIPSKSKSKGAKEDDSTRSSEDTKRNDEKTVKFLARTRLTKNSGSAWEEARKEEPNNTPTEDARKFW